MNIKSEGSFIKDSVVLGEVFLDRYACITRSSLLGYNAIGCFSYVRNSILGRYTHIGSRVSVRGQNTHWIGCQLGVSNTEMTAGNPNPQLFPLMKVMVQILVVMSGLLIIALFWGM